MKDMKTMNRNSRFATAIMIPALLLCSGMVIGQTGSDLLNCDCALERLDDAYCNSAVVFKGIPIRTDTTFAVAGLQPDETDGIRTIAVTFRVVEQLKGLPLQEMIVNTAVEHDPCAFRFLPGKVYLVFARNENDKLVTDRCTPTRDIDLIGQAFADSLEYVRKGNSWHAGVPLDKPCK